MRAGLRATQRDLGRCKRTFLDESRCSFPTKAVKKQKEKKKGTGRLYYCSNALLRAICFRRCLKLFPTAKASPRAKAPP